MDKEAMDIILDRIVTLRSRIAWLEGWIERQTGKTTEEVQKMGPQLPEKERTT